MQVGSAPNTERNALANEILVNMRAAMVDSSSSSYVFNY